MEHMTEYSKNSTQPIYVRTEHNGPTTMFCASPRPANSQYVSEFIYNTYMRNIYKRNPLKASYGVDANGLE